MDHKYTNSLIDETSPYLLQHAHNPVDWMAWNDATLARAKKENKLLLISIGYAACHWCHVMEHESFEDEAVAALMNEHFINIKVDREERPDIDQIYMNAVQLLTGSGGWPLNCIALPDGRPIWGGTYFPKEQWANALEQLINLYEEDPQKVIDYAAQLTEGVQQNGIIQPNTADTALETANLHQAVKTWRPFMDLSLGGAKGAPKFPMPVNLNFLLRYGVQAGDTSITDFVHKSLEKMALGGIYDQVGGGFSRYSVDEKWHIPHFEKMLYDNAQLTSLYATAYQLTKEPLYKQTVYQTLSFVENMLFDKEQGVFYSSLDADSEGATNTLEEGAFYTWTSSALASLLQDDYPLFSAYYSIDDYGHWEHDRYVLIRKETDIEFADAQGISVAKLRNKVAQWRSLLAANRDQRNQPRLDDKTITSWNALMLKGYIDAYTVFDEPSFLETALENAHFIRSKQLRDDGGLYHSYKGGKSTINGYLEDYASVIDAFISLYEVTLDESWLQTAKQLTDYTFDHFFDAEQSMFFFTSDQDRALIARKVDTEDNVIPSSNSIMASNLFKLGHYYAHTYYGKVSRQMLLNVKEQATKYPSGYANWLNLMADFVGDYYEIAIAGTEALDKLRTINQYYFPNTLIAGSRSESSLPLMESRFVEGETLIYVCVDGTCKLPETVAERSVAQLKLGFH